MNELPLHNNYPENSAFIDFDLFEEYPDGTTIWRCCVCGMREAESRLLELRKETSNKLFALNLKDGSRPVIAPAALPARRTVRQAG